jgi:hypothetical protein
MEKPHRTLTAMMVSPALLRQSGAFVLWWLLWAFIPLSVPLRAGELQRFELEAQGDGYRLQAQGLIEAPKQAVWRVLTDYPALHRVSARIIESELVGVTANGVSRVRTLNRLCFLAFCRDLRHLQLIRELSYGDFVSDSVPAESDLARGYARWRLRDQGPSTRLDIDFRFAMDSYAWVPSFISRFVVASALESDAKALIDGIERAVLVRELGSKGD